MKEFTLRNDNGPDIKFTGELIAIESSTDNSSIPHKFTGESGRWTELGLFKTDSGKFVCQSIGRTKWKGERDRFKTKVFDSLEEVKEFFGYGWLAKELYESAKIDASIHV